MVWTAGPSLLLNVLLVAFPARAVFSASLWTAGSTRAQTEGGGAPLSGQNSSDADTLKQMEANYLRAEMEDSAQLASRILADDFVGLRADGATDNKADILDHLNHQSQRHLHYNVTATDMKVRLFGDTACVTYTKIYTLPNNASFSEGVLHVFTKRDGIWRLQLSSPIPKPRVPAH